MNIQYIFILLKVILVIYKELNEKKSLEDEEVYSFAYVRT